MEPSTETKILESLNFIAGTLALLAVEIRAMREAQGDSSQAVNKALKGLGDWLIEAEKCGHRIGKDFLNNISPASPS